MKKPLSDNLVTHLSDLIPQLTAHGMGNKCVFRTNEQMRHAGTQVAYGVFQPGEVCESHVHETMFEYFFFLKGEGTYKIEGVDYGISANSFLEIPAGFRHSLHANKGQTLEFVYWGIATDA